MSIPLELGRTVIGRNSPPRNPLNDISVSLRHAEITRNTNGIHSIVDLHSYSGTFVNNRRIYRPQQLNTGDVIRIGRFEFIFKPGRLEEKLFGLGLDAKNLRKEIGANKNLLQNVSIYIPAGKFVAIVGESGCGKTTLMKALNGIDPATDGYVSIVEKDSKYDLYEFYDSYRNQIGYVPQEDIIHRELTVHEALRYAARLRMPDDIDNSERSARIEYILDTLGLAEKGNQVIAKLSGGERKRVSIGVELLSSPSILFLDEATSGLDPFHESKLMDILRKLSDKERQTVILVTHTTHDITKCDGVAIIAKEHSPKEKGKRKNETRKQSGYLVYYGSPHTAPNSFGVDSFDQIYPKLANEGDEWRNVWRESQPSNRLNERRKPPKPAKKRSSPIKQLLTLFQRDISVLLRDKISLMLMLLIAPVVGLLSATFWRYGIFSPEGGPQGGDAELAVTNLFMAAIICCITGAISSMREIVKEKDIYQRERMVALQILPYILSKTLIAVILGLYQAAVFLFIMKVAGGWPETAGVIFQVYLTLFLATLAGIMQGLLVSALAPNQNVAPLLLIVVIVIQLVFGGIIPNRDRGPVLNKVTAALETVTTTKWAFESMVTLSGMGTCIANAPCWKLTKEEREQLSEQYKNQNCTCMGTTLFKNCCFPGIREYYDPAIDEGEPSKPIRPAYPGDPPPQPVEPSRSSSKSFREWAEVWQRYMDDLKDWGKELEGYNKKISAYQNGMTAYEKKVDGYTNEYKLWQGNRSEAVGKAEGLISTMKQNYGHAFNINVAGHWGILSTIILAILLLLLTVQKLKDQF